MAKAFRYQHLRSLVADKVPSAEEIREGEIAVNLAAGKEKIFLKNTDNIVVKFITEEQVDAKIASGSSGSVDDKIEALSGAIDTNTSDITNLKSQTTEIDSKLESKVNVSVFEAEVQRATAVESALSSGKADKATTLAGYGITDAYTKSQTYTKTEVNGLVDTPHQNYVTVVTYADLPATGSADTIYRVSNWDGSANSGAGAVDATVYSEYAWDGNQYVFLCVKSQIGEVFDITVYNNNTKYDTLADALGTNGEHVPQSLQKGGMSVKYVQNSDDKYVQYRLMSDAFNTTEANWQGVDDEPTAGSNNLVKSGGISKYIFNKIVSTGCQNAAIDVDGNLLAASTQGVFSVSPMFEAVVGAHIINGRKTSANNYMMAAFYDDDMNFVSAIYHQTQESGRFDKILEASDIPSNAKWFRANLDYSTGYVSNCIQKTDNIDVGFLKSTRTSIGVFNNDGTVRPNATYTCLTDYFYAAAGSVIYNLFTINSYITNLVFYDQQFNIVSYIQKPIHSCIVLKESDIPSGAVYFRACVVKNSGYVIGKFAGQQHINQMATVLSKHYAIPTGRGGIDENGELVIASSERITDYFYAVPGSLINNPFGATTAPGNAVFYDEYLNIVDIVTGKTGGVIVLDNTNIPSGAVYFKAALKTNTADSYVVGIVAEGVEDRMETHRHICLFHEFGHIPTISKGEVAESLKLTYNRNTRIFIQDNYSNYIYNSPKVITVNAGDITILRYGALYIDIINSRYAVSAPSYTVVDTETGYDLINNVAYYGKKNLPNGQFLQVMKVGPGYAIEGILMDSIIEKRIQNIEQTAAIGITAFNPSSDYDALMQSAKCAEFNRNTKHDITPPLTGLLWFSDIHAYTKAFANINEWGQKYSSLIDDILSSGDQQSLYFTDNFSWWTNDDILLVLGNHDAWISKAMYDTGDYDDIVERQYGTSDYYIIHQKNCYDKYFKERIANWNVVQPSDAETLGKCYYYKDYDAVRLIILDCMHYGSPDDLDGNNQSIQDAWLQAVLADARTNNKPVVICSHYFPNLIDVVDCNYSSMFQGNGDDKLNSLAHQAVSSFINAGGEFVSWLVGHTHADVIGLLAADNRQLVECITTASVTRANYTPKVRFADTKTADAFNFVCFDTNRKISKTVRIGADMSDMMDRYRKTIYRYADTAAGNKGIVICE